MKVQFRIKREKQGDASPHWDTFDLDCDASTTVLVALQRIRHRVDPSLMLRHSCHHASCGTCAMRINGREKLACVTSVFDLHSSTISVEPLDNLPLVSDLVVDMQPMFGRLAEVDLPTLRSSGGAFARFEDCLECGICMSACPVAATDRHYPGPAALAAAWRVVQEPRGRDVDAVMDWADGQHGCWRCHMAYECSHVCPAGSDPAGSIMQLRGTLARRRLRRLVRRAASVTEAPTDIVHHGHSVKDTLK